MKGDARLVCCVVRRNLDIANTCQDSLPTPLIAVLAFHTGDREFSYINIRSKTRQDYIATG